ncbi:MAG: PHP domain-containing protein [Chloroflexi bacterium]|nr:PHP domain-containing protein [Chloroflexota bacterium]
MLRGDFHMHTHFSSDCMVDPADLVQRCIDVGLNCIAVTDHNSLGGALAVKAIAPFMVITGEEVRSTEGEITALFITEEIPKWLTPMETVKRIRDQGGLVSIPHPHDPFRSSPLTTQGIEEVIPHADIVEAFNARVTLARHNSRGRQIAKEHHLLATAVSDAHTLGELGRCYTELPEFDGTPEGFKAALAEAHLVERAANPLVHVYSTINKLRRKFFRTP